MSYSCGSDQNDDMAESPLNETFKQNEIIETKDKFLATMSHELRTPLNGIVGMINMLSDAGTLNEKQQEYLKILTECSLQLMNLLNNILDFSKINSHRLILATDPFSLRECIERSISIIKGRIINKDVKFSYCIDENIPDKILGDETRLTQVLVNILGNSVKFTEKGYIKLLVRSKKIKNELCQLIKYHKIYFEIQDTGCGIDIEHQSKIFDCFNTIPSSVKFKEYSKSGSGLGLSISKELIKLMKGKINIISNGEHTGTIVKFFIIVEEEISITALQKQYHDLFQNAKILIVDDKQEFRIHLTDLILRWGGTPIAVSSSEEAIIYLKRGIIFDVALIDIYMPCMSGVDLVIHIKKLNIPMGLIALSSIGEVAGKEFFDIFLLKPINQNKIFPALVSCLMKNNNGTKSADTSSSTPYLENEIIKLKKGKAQVKILIAEDDKNNSYTLQEMLYHIGFLRENIKIVNDGIKCIKELESSCIKGECIYDILFLDIFMPEMDGFEVMRKIRMSSMKPFAIIAISASIQSEDKTKCQQLGFTSYISKPILKDNLDTILSSIIVE